MSSAGRDATGGPRRASSRSRASGSGAGRDAKRRSSTSTSRGRSAPTATGSVLVDGPWGIYFRLGRTGNGITGGGLPVLLSDPALDPYGPDNPVHAAEPGFTEFFVSGLATAFRRFRGRAADWRASRGWASSTTLPTTTRSVTGSWITPTR